VRVKAFPVFRVKAALLKPVLGLRIARLLPPVIVKSLLRSARVPLKSVISVLREKEVPDPPHAVLKSCQLAAQRGDLINSRKATVIPTTTKKQNRFNSEMIDFGASNSFDSLLLIKDFFIYIQLLIFMKDDLLCTH
jgi:hypothetical protein